MTKIIRKMMAENQGLFRAQKESTIWAITAMNEDELDEVLAQKLIDGISVKPMTHEKLAEIIDKLNRVKILLQECLWID